MARWGAGRWGHGMMAWWLHKRRMHGLMAAAAHGGLESQEQQILEQYLARHPDAQREFEAMRHLARTLPAERIEPPIDLLSHIRTRLAESPPRAAGTPSWQLAAATAAGFVLVGVFAYQIMSASVDAPSGKGGLLASSSMEHLIHEASALSYQRDYANAQQVLKSVLSTYPSDPHSLEAKNQLAAFGVQQQQLAEEYFEQSHRYHDAYEAYNVLKHEFPETFQADIRNADRLDLLDEARRVNYASLTELDAAKNKRSGALEALEQVIARYPAVPGSVSPSMVASLAADEMAQQVMNSGTLPGEGPEKLRALEQARNRCTAPMAVARLNIEIANYYLHEMNNVDKARDLGTQALNSDDPTAIALARNFLDGLHEP